MKDLNFSLAQSKLFVSDMNNEDIPCSTINAISVETLYKINTILNFAQNGKEGESIRISPSKDNFFNDINFNPREIKSDKNELGEKTNVIYKRAYDVSKALGEVNNSSGWNKLSFWDRIFKDIAQFFRIIPSSSSFKGNLIAANRDYKSDL